MYNNSIILNKTHILCLRYFGSGYGPIAKSSKHCNEALGAHERRGIS
jgi:hypothetical protein